jgi:hypothetical protein
MNTRLPLIMTFALVAAVGCARAKMQASAAEVAAAVDELRADVEVQQLVRTELARTAAAQVSKSKAELAVHEQSKAGDRPQLSEAAEPLLRQSQAISEGSDPRFVPSIADEVDRRGETVEYRGHVDELEALTALLERLAEGSRRAEVQLYLELGAAAAEAAKDSWTKSSE